MKKKPFWLLTFCLASNNSENTYLSHDDIHNKVTNIIFFVVKKEKTCVMSKIL